MMMNLNVPPFSPDMAKLCLVLLSSVKLDGKDAGNLFIAQVALTHIVEGRVICVASEAKTDDVKPVEKRKRKSNGAEAEPTPPAADA